MSLPHTVALLFFALPATVTSLLPVEKKKKSETENRKPSKHKGADCFYDLMITITVGKLPKDQLVCISDQGFYFIFYYFFFFSLVPRASLIQSYVVF